MKNALFLALILGIAGCASTSQTQITEDQPEMLQCKILCSGGDTYAFNKAGLNCQCRKPVETTTINIVDGTQLTEETLVPLSNGRYIISKTKKSK